MASTAVTDHGSSEGHEKYPIYNVKPQSEKVTSVHTAAQFGDKKYIISALEKTLDLDVNGMDQVGRTAIHWAVENGHKSVVRALLDYAADPTIPEVGSGRSPFFLAVKNNDVDMLEMLTERLSKEHTQKLVNTADRSGITPLHWCRERQEDHQEALVWLMQRGARYEQNERGKN